MNSVYYTQLCSVSIVYTIVQSLAWSVHNCTVNGVQYWTVCSVKHTLMNSVLLYPIVQCSVYMCKLLYSVQCIVYTIVKSKVYTIVQYGVQYCRVCIVKCTLLNSVYYTQLYSVQCTLLCSVYCIVYTIVQCIVYC